MNEKTLHIYKKREKKREMKTYNPNLRQCETARGLSNTDGIRYGVLLEFGKLTIFIKSR